MTQSISIIGGGLICGVGGTAATSCAAIRAGLNNFVETRFFSRNSEPLIGSAVTLHRQVIGRQKLLQMLIIAVTESLSDFPDAEREQFALLLCVAEVDRPGRLAGLDESLQEALEEHLGIKFHPQLSAVIPMGRVSVISALARARDILAGGEVDYVVIAATDSYLVESTLDELEKESRLLTAGNSNGFVPGEAAGAIILSRSSEESSKRLCCDGIGQADEFATIRSEHPLRAAGLCQAISAALSQANCKIEQVDYRISGISGEQYYFKEAALSVGRLLRVRRDNFPLVHPADCIGEVGAAIGPAIMLVAQSSYFDDWAPGPNVLVHLSNDDGLRAAALLRPALAVRR